MKKRVLAIIAVVLMVSMYIAAFVFALMKSEFANTMLKISIMCTIFIPVVAYVIMMFYKLGHPKEDDDKE